MSSAHQASSLTPEILLQACSDGGIGSQTICTPDCIPVFVSCLLADHDALTGSARKASCCSQSWAASVVLTADACFTYRVTHLMTNAHHLQECVLQHMHIPVESCLAAIPSVFLLQHCSATECTVPTAVCYGFDFILLVLLVTRSVPNSSS